VTNAHYDPSVLRSVIGPRQLFKLRATTDIDMKGVIPNRLYRANAFEQVFAGVVYLGNKTVFHDRQPAQPGSKLDAKALETETNAKYRREQFIRKFPEVLDDSDILWIFR